jgi:hypothetical protein
MSELSVQWVGSRRFLSALSGALMLLAARPSYAAPAQHKPDACRLLTSKEIQAVQGEAVKETKLTQQSGAGMVVSQCVFLTPTPVKSVSVVLTAPDPASPSSTAARDLWQKQFNSSKDEASESKAPGTGKNEHESEQERNRPLPIDGIGEQAFWTGTRVSGALYVLQGNSFVRISIGGEKDQSARIRKSKTLARALVKRL